MADGGLQSYETVAPDEGDGNPTGKKSKNQFSSIIRSLTVISKLEQYELVYNPLFRVVFFLEQFGYERST